MAVRQTPRRYRIITKRGKNVLSDTETDGSYGAIVWLPVQGLVTPGQAVTVTYTVEYLGEKQFKTPLAKRQAAAKRNDERREQWAKEQAQKRMTLNRARIVNQIDHAFVKEGQNAAPFITCDSCSALAAALILTHEAEGTTIAFDQIAGARCGDHFNPQYNKEPFVECAKLEFFFDGVKQIYINKTKAA
jgi:hypothetical protein